MVSSQIISFVLLGTCLGVVGQGIRAVVGIKKALDKPGKTKLKKWFDSNRLIISLLVGAVSGCLA